MFRSYPGGHEQREVFNTLPPNHVELAELVDPLNNVVTLQVQILFRTKACFFHVNFPESKGRACHTNPRMSVPSLPFHSFHIISENR